jgi:hypothetical protein
MVGRSGTISGWTRYCPRRQIFAVQNLLESGKGKTPDRHDPFSADNNTVPEQRFHDEW